MSNSKHTPGPWTCDEIRTKEAHRAWCVLGEGNRKIAIIPAYTPGEDQEMEANTRMFTAAPEMLEALKKARQSLDDITDLEAVCRSGGPDPMDLQGLWDNLSAAVLIAAQLDDDVSAAIAKAEGGE